MTTDARSDLGVMSLAINFAADFDGPPEWLCILRAGKLDTRDGRGPFFNDDADAIIEATLAQQMELGLPCDLDHSTDFAAPKGSPAPAAGWITALENRDGAVWGKISWTTLGKEALSWGPNSEPPKWRYCSPVFTYDEKTGRIQALMRLALTNQPNLFQTAINSRSRGKAMTTPEKIARLKAELAADSLSEAEMAICTQTGVSHSDFRAARAKRREITLNDVNATPVKIEPFMLDRVPPPRFVTG